MKRSEVKIEIPQRIKNSMNRMKFAYQVFLHGASKIACPQFQPGPFCKKNKKTWILSEGTAQV